MFQKAYERIHHCTIPVITSRLTVGGACAASLAAAVVVNKEGWIVTAFHVLKEYQDLIKACDQTTAADMKIAAIQNDQSLDRAERKKRLSTIKKPNPKDSLRHSAWWGSLPTQLVEWRGIELIDIAVGRLQPWDPNWVAVYPEFKDLSKVKSPWGTSLCKLGFPFHNVATTWNQAKQMFELPAA